MQEPLDDADNRCDGPVDLKNFYYCFYLPSLFPPLFYLLLYQQCTILFLFVHKPQTWNRKLVWETRLLPMSMKLERVHPNWFDSPFHFCFPAISVWDFVQISIPESPLCDQGARSRKYGFGHGWHPGINSSRCLGMFVCDVLVQEVNGAGDKNVLVP